MYDMSTIPFSTQIITLSILLTNLKPTRSVINFTFDKMTDNCFNFLDFKLLTQPDEIFASSVFIKSTDKGVYVNNYNAFSPEIYIKKQFLRH